MNKILKFSASWCNPCKQMEVQIKKLNDVFDTSHIESVDIEATPLLAKQYNVRSVPTLVKIDADGTEIARSVGSLDNARLVEFLS